MSFNSHSDGFNSSSSSSSSASSPFSMKGHSELEETEPGSPVIDISVAFNNAGAIQVIDPIVHEDGGVAQPTILRHVKSRDELRSLVGGNVSSSSSAQQTFPGDLIEVVADLNMLHEPQRRTESLEAINHSSPSSIKFGFSHVAPHRQDGHQEEKGDEEQLVMLSKDNPTGWKGEVFTNFLVYGWLGSLKDKVHPQLLAMINEFAGANKLFPVHCSEVEYKVFYEEICNGILWEICHNGQGFEDFIFEKEGEQTRFKLSVIPAPDKWAIMKNRMNFIALAWVINNYGNSAQPRNRHPVFWIHDYHHFLLANSIHRLMKGIAHHLSLGQQHQDASDELYIPVSLLEFFKTIPEIQKIMELQSSASSIPTNGSQESQIKQALNKLFTLAYFHHIPFVSHEVWKLFYEAAPGYAIEILKGLLNNNIITFHCDAYRQCFIDVVKFTFSSKSVQQRIVSFKDKEYCVLAVNNKKIILDVKPLGLNVALHSRSTFDASSLDRILRLKEDNPNRKILLSMSRLDPPKGILQFLGGILAILNESLSALNNNISGADKASDIRKAIARLGEFSVMLQVIPSRLGVPAYKNLNDKIGELRQQILSAQVDINKVLAMLLNDINVENNRDLFAKQTKIRNWVVIDYIDKGLSKDEYHTLQMFCDAVFVATLTDGLNLIGGETILSQQGKLDVLQGNEELHNKLGTTASPAALVTSRLTGLSSILGSESGALVLDDPKNLADMKAVILHVLDMLKEERMQRFKSMDSRVRERLDLRTWSDESKQLFCDWRQIINQCSDGAKNLDELHAPRPGSGSLFSSTSSSSASRTESENLPNYNVRQTG